MRSQSWARPTSCSARWTANVRRQAEPLGAAVVGARRDYRVDVLPGQVPRPRGPDYRGISLMTAPLAWGFFGVNMNVWLDAALRLQLIVIIMTVTVMALIYLERKFVGRLQMRLGPMRTGPYGSLQSIADAIKLLTKEDLRPSTADFWLFEIAPYVTFVPVFMTLL